MSEDLDMPAETMRAEPSGGGNKMTKTFDRDFKNARRASSQWRERAKKYYQCYEGNPWPDGAKESMESEGRPAVSFNYALSQINAVIGQDIADRKEAKFQGIGSEIEDQFAADVITNVVRSLYQKCAAQREETEAHQDQLVTGYGFTEVFLDTSRFPIWPVLSSVDCAEMYWDPNAKKNNLRDARYLIRRKYWTLEDAIARWPSKKSDLKRAARAGQGRGGIFPKRAVFNQYTATEGDTDSPEDREEHVYVYDYQYRRKEPWTVYTDPTTGRQEKVPTSEFAKIKEALFSTPGPDGQPVVSIETVQVQLESVYRCFLANSGDGATTLLEKPARLETPMFTYRCATGYRTKTTSGRVEFFGLMALIYEPQLWTAKALSAAIEHIARSPKGGGGFINIEMLADPEDFKQRGSTQGYWALTNPGFNPKEHVHERQQPAFSQAYEKLFAMAENAMGRLTTITDYFKGTSSQERSNVLVTNLQGQTMMVLNPLIDPLSQMRVENALLMGRLAQTYIQPDDFNRLAGEMEAEDVTYTIAKDPMTGMDIWQNGEPVKQPIPLTDDMGQPVVGPDGMPIPITPWDVIAEKDLFDFDVTVDLGPASTTAKQAIWQNFTQTALMQSIIETKPQVGDRLLPFLAKNMPGVSADEAKQLEEGIREDLRQEKMQGTMQGIMESLQMLPPEAVAQVAQMATELSMQTQQPQQGAPAPAGPPQ